MSIEVGQKKNDRWIVAGICIFLAGVTLAVFGQTRGFDFIDFDDGFNVYDNAEVAGGLTSRSISTAFSYSHTDNWIPLTTLSHILDCQFYGLQPGGHHRTNVILHALAVVLLFLVLRQMTGALWRAAFVAAVFAIHPLRAESVAWVSERKDVLSGVFFMLMLWAYGRKNNALVFVFLALGLMSKPMLVTAPLVLLLLDYWPLQKMAEGRKLIVQKIPLFVLVAAMCAMTVITQSRTRAIEPLQSFSIPQRLSNALVSYVAYMGQMFYPAKLAAFYPRPENGYPFWEIAGAFLLLAGISAGVFIARRKSPYLLTGWLWYLGMLVPVTGIMQAGRQARADRFTYLPQIGLYIMVAWGIAELCAGWRHRRVALGCAAAMVIGALVVCARAQTSYWKDSQTLWAHALACNPRNVTAWEYRGYAFLQNGQVDEAMRHFRKAIEIQPDDFWAYYFLGNAFVRKGELDEAITQFQTALKCEPNFADAHNNLGNALVRKGELDEGIAQIRKSLELRPNHARSENNLGNALLQKGDVDEAITHFQRAVSLQPEYVLAWCNLGNTFLGKGEWDKALTNYQKAIELKPDFVATQMDIQNNLGHIAWVFATSSDPAIRDGAKALKIAQQADRLSGGKNPKIAGALAAAYAETGQFTDAITAGQRAVQLAENQNNPGLAAALQKQLKLYQAGSPFHEAGP